MPPTSESIKQKQIKPKKEELEILQKKKLELSTLVRPLPIFHRMPPTSGSKTKKTIKIQRGRIQREIKMEGTNEECNKESNKRKQRIRGVKG